MTEEVYCGGLFALPYLPMKLFRENCFELLEKVLVYVQTAYDSKERRKRISSKDEKSPPKKEDEKSPPKEDEKSPPKEEEEKSPPKKEDEKRSSGEKKKKKREENVEEKWGQFLDAGKKRYIVRVGNAKFEPEMRVVRIIKVVIKAQLS